MEERQQPESQQPNLQQEPGDVPAWMTWVANEDKATRMDVKAEIKDTREEVRATRTELKGEIGEVRTELKGDIKASEERQGKLLRTEVGAVRTELKATEERLERKIEAGVNRVVATVIGVAAVTVTLLAWILGPFNGQDAPAAPQAPMPVTIVGPVPAEAAVAIQRLAQPPEATGAGAAAEAPAPAPAQAEQPAVPPQAAASVKPASAAGGGQAPAAPLPAGVAAATGAADWAPAAGAAAPPRRE